jgi:hypothetical protein
MNSVINKYKPAIARRYLMMIAAIVWLFAGGMLFYKGVSFMIENPSHIALKLIISIAFGLLFFAIMFSKIVAKHITRILNIKHEKPCLFSFFNWKSYLMMGSMITLGILLRTFHLIPMEYLSCFYVSMGTPLLISSHRFFKLFFNPLAH